MMQALPAKVLLLVPRLTSRSMSERMFLRCERWAVKGEDEGLAMRGVEELWCRLYGAYRAVQSCHDDSPRQLYAAKVECVDETAVWAERNA